MRFRAISAIQVSSVLTGQIVAVAWAWSYRDYWALVFMPVATTLVRASATWIVCGWWPGLPRRRSNVTPLIGFGLYLTGMNVVNYLARNVDYVLIGWYWGESLLGFYERAYKLLMFPLQQLNAPMSAVALPALSRLKNEPERYRSFWRKGCLIAAMIQIPIVMVAAINSQELVRILLGPGWDVSVSTFRALIPAMLLTFTAPATTWVFVSWGRPDKQLRLALVSTVITITGFAVSLPFGIVAMAWTFSCMQVAVRPFAIAYCFHGTPLRWTDFWQGVSLPATAALTALPVYMVINWSLPTLDSDIARFALKSVLFLGVFVLVTLTMASGRQFVRELIVMISQSTSRTAGNKTVIT
jgi:O-antigen/teichoic acid export membrane protein